MTSKPASSRRWRACSSRRASSSASKTSRRLSRLARRIASAIPSWPRACRSSCGAASRTTSCSTWPAKDRLRDPAVLQQQVEAHAGGPEVRRARPELRRPVALPARARQRADGGAGLRRQPAPARSAARPRCSSTASCARIGRIIELLDADYTFVDERLARHYGIPNVRGSHFRGWRWRPTARAAACSATAAC